MPSPSAQSASEHPVKELDSVTIRFAGDSGDGMQLTGTQFTNTSAMVGNDLATMPDYPAEIRAPAGSLGGVSGFQLQISSHEIYTPGDDLDVLVAMNPAAFKMNIPHLRQGGVVIANTGAFTPRNLGLAGYESDPLDDTGKPYTVIKVDVTTLTQTALKDTGLSAREIERSKNFFTLGLVYWLYSRPLEPTVEWLKTKFKKKPDIADANVKALQAGYTYGEATQVFHYRYKIPARAGVRPGTYVNVTGNRAVALGLVAAAERGGLPLFLGSYPITPATEILQELSGMKKEGVITFQAEDEIAAMTATVGAAFGGVLAATSTSGPGLALKTEAIGLGVIAELPMVIVNVQRGGPSTGLPTKTEQADLLQAMYARNGEAPVAVIAAKSPGDCFHASVEAARLAMKYMTPVVLLTDGYLANGAEPWRVPEMDELPEMPTAFRTDPEGFAPYVRDEKTLARPWVRPGTPGLEHRIGGLEKKNVSGGISYDPENHQLMVELRQDKIDRIANDIEPAELNGEPTGDLLLIAWGGTYGAITAAVDRAQAKGQKVGYLHLRHINPMPKNVGEVLKGYQRVLVPELNNGQLLKLIRQKYLVDAKGLNKIKGLPFRTTDIEQAIDRILG